MFSSWRREFTIRSWGLKGLTLIFRLWLWPFTLCFYSNKICLHNQIHTAHGERWTLTKDSKSGKPNTILFHIKGKLGNTTAGHATNSVAKMKKNQNLLIWISHVDKVQRIILGMLRCFSSWLHKSLLHANKFYRFSSDFVCTPSTNVIVIFRHVSVRQP